jgi:hypothetical protein
MTDTIEIFAIVENKHNYKKFFFHMHSDFIFLFSILFSEFINCFLLFNVLQRRVRLTTELSLRPVVEKSLINDNVCVSSSRKIQHKNGNSRKELEVRRI